jgi:hypothetical protein
MPFEQCPWRRTALAAGAFLIASVLSAPLAAATPIGKAVGNPAAAVPSLPASPSATPSLPSAAPPATPPAPPVATPATPKAPANLPPKATPAPSPSPTSPRGTATPSPPPTGSGVDVPADVPAVERRARGTAKAVGSVPSAAKETLEGAAPSRIAGGRAPILQNGQDAGASEAAPRAIGGSSTPPSIRAAEVAPLRRWLARIWPAIPLGGGAGSGWAARLIAGDLFRPPAAAIARLLSLVPPITRAPGDSPFAGHPGAANAPQPDLPNPLAGTDGTKIVYLAVLAVLLALLAFTIWREFRSALRPRVR